MTSTPLSWIYQHQSICLKTSYLVDSENLTSSLLHLLQSVHEIPVAGLGSDGVGSEESHSVDLGLGIVLSRESATDDVIVVNLQNERIQP